MHKTAIIIPAYNEEKRIGKTLEHYSRFFERMRKEGSIAYEILVSINNSTDKTKDIVQQASRTNRYIHYLDLPLGGKGYAVIEALKDALQRNNQTLGFVDADMATSPEEYWKLLTVLITTPRADGVIASRYIPGAKIFPKPTLQRKIAKWVFNALVRSVLLLSYRDTQCGAKVFKRETIENVISSLSMSRWAFDVDLLYVASKKCFRIIEVPTVWVNKEYSTIHFWQAGPWMALGVIRLRLLHSPFKILMRIYDKILSRLR